MFRSTADGETGHAFGHLDYLMPVGDPATDEPIGDTAANLKSAIVGEYVRAGWVRPGVGAAVIRCLATTFHFSCLSLTRPSSPSLLRRTHEYSDM